LASRQGKNGFFLGREEAVSYSFDPLQKKMMEIGRKIMPVYPL
jgi:hypothetical protein